MAVSQSRPRPDFRVRALTICCTDRKRSSHFYENVLGATPIPTDIGGLPPWYQLGSLRITLLSSAEKPSPAEFPTHAMPMLWLEVADLAAAAEHFAGHDVPVIDPGDGQFMMVADPDGLVIEVWEHEAGQ
jgi:catechol-2,3-dioxygenase